MREILLQNNLSHAGRVFLFKTGEMKLVAELIIERHEPLPVPNYYPTLINETHLCTDLSVFKRIGEHLVFVYCRDKHSDLENWQDSLIIIPVERVLAGLSR